MHVSAYTLWMIRGAISVSHEIASSLGIRCGHGRIRTCDALGEHDISNAIVVEDEVTEWTIAIYMEPRQWKLKFDLKTFMNPGHDHTR